MDTERSFTFAEIANKVKKDYAYEVEFSDFAHEFGFMPSYQNPDIGEIKGYPIMGCYDGSDGGTTAGVFLYYFRDQLAFVAYRDGYGDLSDITWESKNVRDSVRAYLLKCILDSYDDGARYLTTDDRIPEYYTVFNADDFYQGMPAYYDGKHVEVTPLTLKQLSTTPDPETQALRLSSEVNVAFDDGTSKQVQVKDVKVRVNIE